MDQFHLKKCDDYIFFMKILEINQIKVIIGQNAQENWDIIHYDEKYIWLHLDSFPSCHVIIQSDSPEKDTLMKAAIECRNHTKYRNIRNLKVCYTPCNNLKKGLSVGSVYYKSNKQVKRLTLN